MGSLHRAPFWSAPAIGGKQVQLLPGPMLLKRNMEGFVTNCLDYKSELVAAARRTHPIQKKRSLGGRRGREENPVFRTSAKQATPLFVEWSLRTQSAGGSFRYIRR